MDFSSETGAQLCDGEAEELALCAQNGVRGAFGRLYDTFAHRVYAYLYRRTFCRSTAEDLLSQTFLKALEKLDSFDARRGNFSAWIFRIARNTLFDQSRFRKRFFFTGDMWDMPSSADVEIDAENHALRERLKPYLEELSPREREILFLRIWDGLSHKEIAAVLGKSETSCRMAFSRTIEQLRKRMPLETFLLLFLVQKLIG